MSLNGFLHEKLLLLPDYVQVYPAHISGSPCGRAMSGKPFADAIFASLPPKPPGFEGTVRGNRGAVAAGNASPAARGSKTERSPT